MLGRVRRALEERRSRGWYNATVEVATKEYDVDQVLDQLEQVHPAVGQSSRGWASATISLRAESLPAAAAAACAVVGAAFGSRALSCEVMDELEFLARQR